MSTTVRSGAGCPTGATPPTSWPVAASTNSGDARRTRAAPTSAATLPVSTRWAPLASTSSGSPSASKTRLLAIAPDLAAQRLGRGGGRRHRLVEPADLRLDPAGPQRGDDRSTGGAHRVKTILPFVRPSSIRSKPSRAW